MCCANRLSLGGENKGSLGEYPFKCAAGLVSSGGSAPLNVLCQNEAVVVNVTAK